MGVALDTHELYPCELNPQDVMEVGTYTPIGDDVPCLKLKITEGKSTSTLVLLSKKEMIRLRNQINNILMEL